MLLPAAAEAGGSHQLVTAKFNDHGARLAAGYNTRASGKAVAKVLFVAVEGGGGLLDTLMHAR